MRALRAAAARPAAPFASWKIPVRAGAGPGPGAPLPRGGPRGSWRGPGRGESRAHAEEISFLVGQTREDLGGKPVTATGLFCWRVRREPTVPSRACAHLGHAHFAWACAKALACGEREKGFDMFIVAKTEIRAFVLVKICQSSVLLKSQSQLAGTARPCARGGRGAATATGKKAAHGQEEGWEAGCVVLLVLGKG